MGKDGPGVFGRSLVYVELSFQGYRRGPRSEPQGGGRGQWGSGGGGDERGTNTNAKLAVTTRVISAAVRLELFVQCCFTSTETVRIIIR